MDEHRARADSALAWLAEAGDRLRAALPTGGYLPGPVRRRRHAGILALLWLHLPAFLLVGLVTGQMHAAVSGAAFVALAAALAAVPRLNARARACAATLGLVACSATVIHLAHGLTEARSYFFIMLGVVTLYQDWLPFLVAVAGVFLHEGIAGALDPETVYSHPDAWAHPWRWAAIHAAIALAVSAFNLVAWRLNEFRALHDPLTGLTNRLGFLVAAERGLAGGAWRGMPRLLLLDLDDFKAINDRHGHHAGDELLVGVSARLRASVRRGDVVARLGGDEFAVLLRGVRDDETARMVARRLVGAMAAPYTVGGVTMRAPTSVGVATGMALDGPAELLRRADAALYAAKRRGKGRFAEYAGEPEGILAPA